jgi:hypothetical protein
VVLVTHRGQLVLVAAALIAVALVPMLAAYLQLGYAADVRTTADDLSPTADAIRVLEGAVQDATAGVPASYDWGDRDDAADAVRSRLVTRIETVETALIDRGVARTVTYNASLAGEVASAECPGGAGRQFGDCEADGGIVLQERAGDANVVSVAVDVSSTTEDGSARVATVLTVP